MANTPLLTISHNIVLKSTIVETAALHIIFSVSSSVVLDLLFFLLNIFVEQMCHEGFAIALARPVKIGRHHITMRHLLERYRGNHC